MRVRPGTDQAAHPGSDGQPLPASDGQPYQGALPSSDGRPTAEPHGRADSGADQGADSGADQGKQVSVPPPPAMRTTATTASRASLPTLPPTSSLPFIHQAPLLAPTSVPTSAPSAVLQPTYAPSAAVAPTNYPTSTPLPTAVPSEPYASGDGVLSGMVTIVMISIPPLVASLVLCVCTCRLLNKKYTLKLESDSAANTPNPMAGYVGSLATHHPPPTTAARRPSPAAHRPPPAAHHRPPPISRSTPSGGTQTAFEMSEIGGETSMQGFNDTFVNIGEMSYLIPIEDIQREARPVAAGGGGQVYKGTLRGTPVAIKSIYSQMTTGYMEELEHEVGIVAQ